MDKLSKEAFPALNRKYHDLLERIVANFPKASTGIKWALKWSAKAKHAAHALDAATSLANWHVASKKSSTFVSSMLNVNSRIGQASTVKTVFQEGLKEIADSRRELKEVLKEALSK